MAEYTQNYNLKKPAEDDFYNVKDFNDNADIIDQKLKEIEDKTQNIEVPVTSVNGKTGDVVLTADDVGAETPAGAQVKANAAETNAKNHTNGLVGSLSSLLTTAKTNIVAAINEVFNKAEDVGDNLVTHKQEIASSSVLGHVKQGTNTYIDSNGVISVPNDAFLSSKSDIFITGTYTGNDESSRTINLGFTPSAVILVSQFGRMADYTDMGAVYQGGLALSGHPVGPSTGSSSLCVTTNGFRVGKTSQVETNKSGYSYRYIAFK